MAASCSRRRRLAQPAAYPLEVLVGYPARQPEGESLADQQMSLSGVVASRIAFSVMRPRARSVKRAIRYIPRVDDAPGQVAADRPEQRVPSYSVARARRR